MIRKFHRGVSVLFVLTVIANFIAMARGAPPAWITYSPLLPLALLMLTGIYLFLQPYLAKGRGVTRSAPPHS